MTERTTELSTFGRVLEHLMRARGLGTALEDLAELAERSGLDPAKFVALVRSGKAPGLGSLGSLDEELALSDEAKLAVAMAYAFDMDEVAERIGRGDAFETAYVDVLEDGESLPSEVRERILALLGAERDRAWSEARVFKAAVLSPRE